MNSVLFKWIRDIRPRGAYTSDAADEIKARCYDLESDYVSFWDEQYCFDCTKIINKDFGQQPYTIDYAMVDESNCTN